MIQVAEESLLPLKSCSWREDDVPLSERGVSFKWLYDFVAKIDLAIGEEWRKFRSDQQASFRYDIPYPSPPLYPESNLTTREFIRDFVVPLTDQIKAPLYARIPPEHRGTPSIFISHTWDSYIVRGGHGSLDMVLQNDRDFLVWIDFVCYNQHRVESVALDMNSIISTIGRIAFVLTTQPFFGRSWCLWELVCAHRSGTDMRIYDQRDRIKYKYWSSERSHLPPEFRSVTELSATKKSDQKDILQAMISTFGSIKEADKYIHGILSSRSSDLIIKEGSSEPEFVSEKVLDPKHQIVAARIIKLLAYVGLLVVPIDFQGKAIDDIGLKDFINHHIELLAESEHKEWMNNKLSDGWTPGELLDYEKKIHNLLVPYNELSDNNKERNREVVRGYIDILRHLGLKVIQQ